MALTAVFAAGETLAAAKLNASSIPVVSSTSDIITPYTGQIVFNTTTSCLHRYTGSAWVIWDPNTQWIQKAANESVTSSTTLQNDDHFAFSVAANASYALEGYVIYDGNTTPAGDLKAAFTVPAGATLWWTNFGTNVSNLTQYNAATQNGTASRALPTNGGTTGTISFAPRGYLNTAGTAGTFQFQWAQNVSNATATTVFGGSWMKLTRMG